MNVEKAIQRVNDLIAQEKNLSPAFKASIEALLLLVTILVNRLGQNSKNSSKPSSFDPNRKKEPKEPGVRKPGGQFGHNGATLKPFPDPDPDPDLIKEIRVGRSTLPQGNYRPVRYESRQIVDLDIKTFVIEWRAFDTGRSEWQALCCTVSERSYQTRTIRCRCQDQRCLYVPVSVNPVQPYFWITFWIRWVSRSAPERSRISTRMPMSVLAF